MNFSRQAEGFQLPHHRQYFFVSGNFKTCRVTLLKTFLKKHSVVILLVHLYSNLNAQKVEVPVSSFLKTQNKLEYYEDTANEFTGTFAPLEVNALKVEFESVSIDRNKKKAYIRGFVCDYHSKDWKIGGVQIFKAKRLVNKLKTKVSLGITSFDNGETTTDEGGQFDLVFDFIKGERLYFYRPFSYIIEFNIEKLLR